MKKKNSLMRATSTLQVFFVVIILQFILTDVMTAICYNDINLPRLIGHVSDDNNVFMKAMAASEQLNALFVGGGSGSPALLNQHSSDAPIILRLDLE